MLSGIGACHDARIVHRAVAAHMSQRKQCWVRGILCLWPCLASLAFEETSNWITSCTAARTKRPSSCPTSGLLPKSLRLATSRAAWASTQRVAFALGSGLCQTLASGVSGTAPYMSPEMLAKKSYSTQTDVWSFASTVQPGCLWRASG